MVVPDTFAHVTLGLRICELFVGINQKGQELTKAKNVFFGPFNPCDSQPTPIITSITPSKVPWNTENASIFCLQVLSYFSLNPHYTLSTFLLQRSKSKVFFRAFLLPKNGRENSQSSIEFQNSVLIAKHF